MTSRQGAVISKRRQTSKSSEHTRVYQRAYKSNDLLKRVSVLMRGDNDLLKVEEARLRLGSNFGSGLFGFWWRDGGESAVRCGLWVCWSACWRRRLDSGEAIVKSRWVARVGAVTGLLWFVLVIGAAYMDKFGETKLYLEHITDMHTESLWVRLNGYPQYPALMQKLKNTYSHFLFRSTQEYSDPNRSLSVFHPVEEWISQSGIDITEGSQKKAQ